LVVSGDLSGDVHAMLSSMISAAVELRLHAADVAPDSPANPPQGIVAVDRDGAAKWDLSMWRRSAIIDEGVMAGSPLRSMLPTESCATIEVPLFGSGALVRGVNSAADLLDLVMHQRSSSEGQLAGAPYSRDTASPTPINAEDVGVGGLAIEVELLGPGIPEAWVSGVGDPNDDHADADGVVRGEPPAHSSDAGQPLPEAQHEGRCGAAPAVGIGSLGKGHTVREPRAACGTIRPDQDASSVLGGRRCGALGRRLGLLGLRDN
jgi:hypothetical protein